MSKKILTFTYYIDEKGMDNIDTSKVHGLIEFYKSTHGNGILTSGVLRYKTVSALRDALNELKRRKDYYYVPCDVEYVNNRNL